MTSPQYVKELTSVYEEMYNPPGNEKVLEEKSEEHDFDIPKWARVLHKHKQEEDNKRPPHTAHVEQEVDAEEDENENTGVGSGLVNKYLDALELKNQSTDHQAQEYLKTIIDIVPTAVGGVNIHKIIKDAFIAGTKAR
tara:strand:+ start:3085 stop:3498 length:414 start_codon:yes stop_codon:yes gene_type:complete